jgi:hypothetical protein
MKTPEEMAEELDRQAVLYVSLKARNDVSYYVGMDCYRAGYKAAAPQWISVKDRLPEEHKSVLGIVYDEIRLGYIELVSTDPGQFHWSGPGMYIDKGHYALTYWQELPEPPKEEG